MDITAVKTCDLGHDARCLAVAADGRRILAAAEDGALAVVGPDFTVTHRFKGPYFPCNVALHPTSNLIAVANKTSVTVVDGAKTAFGYEHRTWTYRECGAVAFVGNGSRLLAVGAGQGSNEVMLIRLVDGKIVGRETIDIADECSYHLVPHPGGEGWVLYGAGEWDEWSRWVTLEGDRVVIAEIRVFRHLGHGPVSFHPSGGEMTAMCDGDLVRYGFPDLGMRARWRPELDDDFEMHVDVAYVGERRAILANKRNSRLYVAELESMDLEPLYIEMLQPTLWYYRRLSPEAIVTVHGDYQRNTLALLKGPPLFV